MLKYFEKILINKIFHELQIITQQIIFNYKKNYNSDMVKKKKVKQMTKLSNTKHGSNRDYVISGMK